jgi:hypothetical protein
MFISIEAYVRFADHLAAQTVINAQRSGIFLFGATIMSPLIVCRCRRRLNYNPAASRLDDAPAAVTRGML